MRERILAAAVDTVRAEGIRGLSQARVAAAAGVRQSHLTYYFPTRKHLMKALVQRILAGTLEGMSALAPTSGRAAPSLTRAREFFAERIRDPLFARLMVAMMVAADEDRSLRRWLAERDADLRDQLRETLGRLGLRAPDADVALLHASIVGASTLAIQAGTRAAADQAADLGRAAFDRLAQKAMRKRGGGRA